MKTLLTLSCISVLFVSLTFAIDQPNMMAARRDLNQANAALRKASADKGGHREKAMNLISRAIAAVDDGIEYDRTHLTPGKRGRLNFVSFQMPGSYAVDQPHMQAAKDHLESALSYLQRASADKGGYREKAIDLVREAIAEVNKGIAFDRSN